MVRGCKREAAALAEFVKQSDSQRRALFRSCAGAQLVHEDERTRRGGFEHRAHECGGRRIDARIPADHREEIELHEHVEVAQGQAVGGLQAPRELPRDGRMGP